MINDPIQQIVLRVPASRRAAYMRASRAKRMALAAWIYEQCDPAAAYLQPPCTTPEKTLPNATKDPQTSAI